jgi:RNA polymerase sigma factor (sigma-70 family)
LAEEKEILELLFEKGARDKAFERMLDQYQKPIYFYIRRMVLDHDDADDVCQNTFIKAWKGLDQFRGDSKVSTWLYRIALHRALNVKRNQGRRKHVDFDDARNGPAIQDLWMLLSGTPEEMQRQMVDVLDGYRDFMPFDRRELHLVEALRTLRLLHYSAWIARRWDDPAFPSAFPWFNTQRYWQDHILALREQDR